MLTHYYQSEHFAAQIRAGPGGSYMDEFAQVLWEAGYVEITARRHIRAAQHLVHWAHRQHVPIESLDEGQLQRFKRHLLRCRCRPYGSSDHALVRGARLFVAHLRRVDPIPRRGPLEQKLETSPLLDAFCQWMRTNRNIADGTLYNYSLAVRDLLQTLGNDPSRFDAQALREFVLDRSRRCGRAKAKMIVTALRAFTRFLIAADLCSVGLDAAIPSLAHWHLSALPRYLQPDDVERVVEACSPDTPVGIRDRAIVLLLARLALRANDIVGMQLDDIDWQEGWIRVCGKGRRDTHLPLLQEVGEAIFAYVTGSRPAVGTNTLFVRSRAPLRGFASHAAISVIVASAMRRAGVVCPARGAAHVLRHSAATTMLRQGASLQEIGAVLRHRSMETTSIYAKVDVLALREIAQPWPEVGTC